MENKFSPDLTGDVPEGVCASCAVTHTLGLPHGLAVVYCEHSRKGYTRTKSEMSWRRCRLADIADIVRRENVPGPLRQLLAKDDVNHSPTLQ